MLNSNWREILQNQRQETEIWSSGVSLNELKLSEDIDRILKKPLPSASDISTTTSLKSKDFMKNSQSNYRESISDDPLSHDITTSNNDKDNNNNSSLKRGQNNPKLPSNSKLIQTKIVSRSKTPTNVSLTTKNKSLTSDSSAQINPLMTGVSEIESTPSLLIADAPQTSARYQSARIKLLTQQVHDMSEQRRSLLEQVGDLQRQLKSEKEENKQLKKRVQVLETDMRRNSTNVSKKSELSNDNDGTIETLTQQVAGLQKDLQAAERLVKQTEMESRIKDVKLKKAADVISKLKAQVTELQQVEQNNRQMSGGIGGERTKLEEADVRIKQLEKQKSELIIGFRKQMRLIDLLKKQKIHMEAMALIGFTEAEFVKTLDWSL